MNTVKGQTRGRKSKFNFVEITDRSFTLNDLKKMNPDIGSPTMTAFLNRQRKSGRYVLVPGVKSKGRGKPSNSYKLKHLQLSQSLTDHKPVEVKPVSNLTKQNKKSSINNKDDMKVHITDKLESKLNTSALDVLVDVLNKE
jgi:hypothetical protein